MSGEITFCAGGFYEPPTIILAPVQLPVADQVAYGLGCEPELLGYLTDSYPRRRLHDFAKFASFRPVAGLRCGCIVLQILRIYARPLEARAALPRSPGRRPRTRVSSKSSAHTLAVETTDGEWRTPIGTKLVRT